MAELSKGSLIVNDDSRAPNHSLSPVESDGGSERSTGVIQTAPKRTWRSYLWDTWDKPPEERRLLFKIDLAIMVHYPLKISFKEYKFLAIANKYLDSGIARILHQISRSGNSGSFRE